MLARPSWSEGGFIPGLTTWAVIMQGIFDCCWEVEHFWTECLVMEKKLHVCIYFWVTCQHLSMKGCAASSYFQFSLCFQRSVQRSVPQVTKPKNIRIRIWSLLRSTHDESIFRSPTTVPKYFDKIFQYNVGKKDGFGYWITKYQKPYNHSAGQITQEHFWGLQQRRRREMVLPGAIS